MSWKRYKGYQVCIMSGNAKLLKVANVSLPPIQTCNRTAGCVKCRLCYALHFYESRKTVREAWDDNLALYRKDRALYFSEISRFISDHKPRFFRWHVAGDCPDKWYLAQVIALAREYPETRFLMFTKRHTWLPAPSRIPKNLSVVLSMWTDSWGNMRRPYPRAWYQDGTEKRIPDDAIECIGTCEQCGMCWSLRDIGKDVVFFKH